MKVNVNIKKKAKLKVGDTFFCDSSSNNNLLRKIVNGVDGKIIVIRYEKGDLTYFNDIEHLNGYYEIYARRIRKVKITELTVNCEER